MADPVVMTSKARLTGEPSERVRPDLLFAPGFVAHAHWSDRPHLDCSFVAEWNREGLRYDLSEIKLTSHSDITREDLRSIRRSGLMSLVLHQIAHIDYGDRTEPLHFNSVEMRELGAAGPNVDTLKQVARIYAAVRAVGGTPNKAVLAGFGVSQTTATRWIANARKLEYLD